MLRIVIIPLLLTALLGASIIWSGEGREKRADFAYINRGDNMTLDLNDMSYAQDIRTANALWEGLYRLSPLHPEPFTALPIWSRKARIIALTPSTFARTPAGPM